MNDQEAALLERIAREYVDPDPGRMVDQKIQALLVARLMPWVVGPDVLELGFGDDRWTAGLIERFGHSSVVEAADTLVQRARARYGSRVTVHHALFEDFEPPGKFTTVIASLVLEHVIDAVEVLRRCANWLAPGGHVLVVVPHAASLHRRLAVCMGMQAAYDELGATDVKMGHRRVYTIERMQADLQRAGLRIVRQKGLLTKSVPQAFMTGLPDAVLAGLVVLGETLPMEYSATIAFDCVRAEG